MKTRRKLVLAGLGSLLIATGASAADITWGAPFELTSTADIDVTGLEVIGVNGGIEENLVVNGITFENFTVAPDWVEFSAIDGTPPSLGATTPGSVSVFSVFNDVYDNDTDSFDLDDILATHVYETTDAPDPITFTLNNLVPGADYRVQVLGPADTRGCCSGRTLDLDGGDTNAPNGVTIGRLQDLDMDTVANAVTVVGTFTADATTQDFTISSDNAGTGLAGLVFARLTEGGIPEDLDMDGDVDDADFGIAFAAFTGPGGGPTTSPADLDGDGDVDDADFGIAFAAFTGPGGAAAVPEPTSLALLGLGGLLIARRRRA